MFVFSLVFACSVVAQSSTAAGVGGGGWLHSGAFHPTDDEVVVLGADVCGVVRSDDGGRSWRPWNEGLPSPHESNERYVDDLLGVRIDGVDWFFAATYGGIHRRPADDLPGAEWERTTPLPETSFKSASKFEAEPIPFSCLDDADGGRLLVAGAGRTRWEFPGYETDYYPGVAALDPAWTPGPARQWTVWKHVPGAPGPAGTAWQPFPGSAGLGSARDVSAARVAGTLVVAVATPTGIYLWRGAGWEDVGGELYDDLGLTAWSLHLTERGDLFAGTDRAAGPGSSGAYRLSDVLGPKQPVAFGGGLPGRVSREPVPIATPTWEWVGDTTLMPPVGTKTLQEIGQNARQPFLTVVDGVGARPDRLYLGVRFAFSPRNAGMYAGELSSFEPASSCTWRHVVYGEFLSGTFDQIYRDRDGIERDLGSGWLDFFGSEVLWHPTVSRSNPGRVVLQLNSRLHALFLDRDGSKQAYAIPTTVGADTFWESRGYNELSVRGLAFYPDGRLVESAADIGAFVSEDDTLQRFRRLEVATSATTSSTSDVAWNPATTRIELRPAWGSPAEDTLFLNNGDVVQRESPCKLFRVDAAGAWHNITASFDGDPDVGGLVLENMQLGDFTFVDDDEIFVIYTEFDRSLRTSPVGAKRISCGVLRGTHSAGVWDWSLADAGLGVTDTTIPETRNAQGEMILYNPPSGRVFLAARTVKYNEASPAPSIRGGLFALDPTSFPLTWERVIDPDTTSYRDFWSLAQYPGGAGGPVGTTIYAGSRGRSTGDGAVFRNADPAGDHTAWTPIANDTTFPFQFAVPFSRDPLWAVNSWDQAAANRRLTDVRALAVHPAEPDVLVAGLYSPNFNEQVGLWRYHAQAPTPWTHLSPGEPFEGISVASLAFSPTVTNRLVLGTNGQEIFYKTVGTQISVGMGEDDPETVEESVRTRAAHVAAPVAGP